MKTHLTAQQVISSPFVDPSYQYDADFGFKNFREFFATVGYEKDSNFANHFLTLDKLIEVVQNDLIMIYKSERHKELWFVEVEINDEDSIGFSGGELIDALWDAICYLYESNEADQ